MSVVYSIVFLDCDVPQAFKCSVCNVFMFFGQVVNLSIKFAVIWGAM